jgi:sec-independent protein translocase protein TatB
MFDIFDPSKIFIVGVVALIVIGPKELPRVMRTVGQVVGRMRRMANEFQQQFNEAMREAELEDVKKELAAMESAAKVDVSLEEPPAAFDPTKLTQHDNAKAFETETAAIEAPPIEARHEADLDDVKRELAALSEAAKTDPAKPTSEQEPIKMQPNGAAPHDVVAPSEAEVAPPQTELAESAARGDRAP